MLEKLKSDSLAARKAKDSVKSNLLVTLISEVEMVAKNDGNRKVTDADVLPALKKFLKGINESIAAFEKGGRDTEQPKAEKEILETYLPTQLSEAELSEIISKMIEAEGEKSMKLMGKIMGQLKGKYDGQYDGKMASALVKKLLA